MPPALPPWILFVVLAAGVALGLMLERFIARRRGAMRPPWDKPFPRAGEFLRLLATDGGHLALGSALIFWGTVCMATGWGKSVGEDVVKMTLGGLLALIKSGPQGASRASGPRRAILACPKCGHKFDANEGANQKPDDPDA